MRDIYLRIAGRWGLRQGGGLNCCPVSVKDRKEDFEQFLGYFFLRLGLHFLMVVKRLSFYLALPHSGVPVLVFLCAVLTERETSLPNARDASSTVLSLKARSFERSPYGGDDGEQ